MNIKINLWGFASIIVGTMFTLSLIDFAGELPSNPNEPFTAIDSLKAGAIMVIVWLLGRYSIFKKL